MESHVASRRDGAMQRGQAFNVCIFDNVHFYTNYFFIPFYFDRVRLWQFESQLATHR